MTTLIGRLAEHLQHNGPVVLSHTGKAFGVASEWGQEADDSPMVGAAAYGMDDDLEAALDHMLAEAGLKPDPFEVAVRAAVRDAAGLHPEGAAQVEAARRAAFHVDDLVDLLDPPAAIGDSPGLENVLDEFVKLLEKLAPGTELPAASVASDLRRLLAGTA